MNEMEFSSSLINTSILNDDYISNTIIFEKAYNEKNDRPQSVFEDRDNMLKFCKIVMEESEKKVNLDDPEEVAKWLNDPEEVIKWLNNMFVRFFGYFYFDRLLSDLFPKKIIHEITEDPDDEKSAKIFAKGYFFLYKKMNEAGIDENVKTVIEFFKERYLGTSLELQREAYAVFGHYLKLASKPIDSNIHVIMDRILEEKINAAKVNPTAFKYTQKIISNYTKSRKWMPEPVIKFSADIIDGSVKKPGRKEGANYLRNFFFALAADRISRNYNFSLSKSYGGRKIKMKPCCFEIVVSAARKYHMNPSYDAVQKAWVKFGPLFTIPAQIDAFLQNNT